MVVQTPSYDTLSWIQVLLLDQISVPLSPDYHLVRVFLHFVFYDFMIYLYFCFQSYVFLYFCNFDQISVALSPDCHLISVSPSSPVFLLLVLHLSPSDYIGSHPQNTRMQTPKYKSTVTNTQAQVFYSSTYTYLNGDEHNSQCDGNYSLRYDQHEQVALYSLLTLSSKQFHP